ncbi:MAG: pyridoxal phosphate-dependent aminotransferase [bacterium]
MILSNRSLRVIASPIRKFAPFMKAAEERGTDVIKLHIGDPDLLPPEALLEGVRNYSEKNLPYAPSAGFPDFIGAWLKYYEDFGVKLNSENVIATIGGTEAIQLALTVIGDSGDELLVFEPFYSGFKALAPAYGINLVPVPLRFDESFKLPSLAEMEKLITPRTKGILIINPDNPTGKLWSHEECTAILELAKKHGIFVLSDETYREIVFKGEPSCLLAHPDSGDRVIIIDSLSKRFSAPGARLGALTSRNTEFMAAALKIAMARLSAPTLGQRAFIPLLTNSKEHTAKVAKEYLSRRDALILGLQNIPGVKWVVPNGAFYMVVKLPVDDAEKFAKFLLTDFSHEGKTVMVTPIKDFYLTPGIGHDEVRIALVRNEKVLNEAVNLLTLALKKYNE